MRSIQALHLTGGRVIGFRGITLQGAAAAAELGRSAAEGLDVRYVVRCHKCTGPEVACAELRENQRCPKCGSAPSTYETGGEQFCWLHRERMAESYPVSAFFLTTVFAWRGHSHRFPNTKLFEAGSEGVFGESPYCCSCQRLYDEFLTAWLTEQQRHAEPLYGL